MQLGQQALYVAVCVAFLSYRNPYIKGPKRQLFHHFFIIVSQIFRDFRAVNVVIAGFWRLKAPETSIWAPEGAFGPEKNFFHSFFTIFWLLACKKKPWSSRPLARPPRREAALAADLITA